jgi:hypothetical protein
MALEELLQTDGVLLAHDPERAGVGVDLEAGRRAGRHTSRQHRNVSTGTFLVSKYDSKLVCANDLAAAAPPAMISTRPCSTEQ